MNKLGCALQAAEDPRTGARVLVLQWALPALVPGGHAYLEQLARALHERVAGAIARGNVVVFDPELADATRVAGREARPENPPSLEESTLGAFRLLGAIASGEISPDGLRGLVAGVAFDGLETERDPRTKAELERARRTDGEPTKQASDRDEHRSLQIVRRAGVPPVAENAGAGERRAGDAVDDDRDDSADEQRSGALVEIGRDVGSGAHRQNLSRELSQETAAEHIRNAQQLLRTAMELFFEFDDANRLDSLRSAHCRLTLALEQLEGGAS